jgi:HAMP domain-containing protein
LAFSLDLESVGRPYYIDAKAAGKGVWTELYVGAMNMPYGTYALPFYLGGVFDGVVAIDFVLSEWDGILRQIDVGEHGFLYIMEKNGAIVAGGTPGVTAFYHVNPDDPFERFYATNLEQVKSKEIVESAKYFLSSEVEDGTLYEIKVDNKDLMLMRTTSNLEGDLSWYVCLVLNKLDYAREIRNANIVAYTLAAFFVILGCLIGLGATFILTHQLNKLSKLMHDVANMQLEHINTKGRVSILSELGAMQNSFYGKFENFLSNVTNTCSKLW